jgi:hypothetical protein
LGGGGIVGGGYLRKGGEVCGVGRWEDRGWLRGGGGCGLLGGTASGRILRQRRGRETFLIGLVILLGGSLIGDDFL